MKGLQVSRCLLLAVIILFTGFASPTNIDQISIVQEAQAVQREYLANITIPANDSVAIDLDFDKGEELEFIYSIVVVEDLPIDIWFIEETSYGLLMAGGQFRYFIDGSGSQLTKATKIVTITDQGNYMMIFKNYNNQSVRVLMNYDVNIYPLSDAPVKDPQIQLWESPLFMGLVVVAIAILVSAAILIRVRQPKKPLGKKEKESHTHVSEIPFNEESTKNEREPSKIILNEVESDNDSDTDLM